MFFNWFSVIGALVFALIFPLVFTYTSPYWLNVFMIFVISVALQAIFNLVVVGIQKLLNS
jgi:hypothetical protein